MMADSFPALGLPPEIWASICALLPLDDAARFRLSCKTFGDVGARSVLRDVVLYAL